MKLKDTYSLEGKLWPTLIAYEKAEILLCQQRSIWSRLWFFQWSCMDVRVGLWRKLSAKKLMLLNCGVGEDSWESLGLQGDSTSPSWRRSVLGVHWKDWCWSWNSNTLPTSCKELTHWKRPWCWDGLGAGGEGDDRGWDSWMASLTQWAWVWVNSRSLWWTGRPGILWLMGSQSWTRLSDWTELNWIEFCIIASLVKTSMDCLYDQKLNLKLKKKVNCEMYQKATFSDSIFWMSSKNGTVNMSIM